MHLKHRFESHFDINIKNSQQYTCKKDKIVLSLQRGSPKKIRQSQTDFYTKHHIRQKVWQAFLVTHLFSLVSRGQALERDFDFGVCPVIFLKLRKNDLSEV